MRQILKGFCLIGVLLLAAIPAFGQDATEVLMPTPTFIPTPVDPSTGSYGTLILTLGEVSFNENICPEDLLAANQETIPPQALELIYGQRSMRFALWVQLPTGLTIPEHDDCYDVVSVPATDLAQVEIDHNICIEEYYSFTRPVDASGDMINVYLRKDAPDCLNEKGYRLQYYKSEGELYEIPVYSEIPFVEGPQDITNMGYCIADLVRANPGIYFAMPNSNDWGDIGYISGMRVFVPEGTRNCGTVPPASGSLYKISQEKNVCMETLLATTGSKLVGFNGEYGLPLQYPLNAAPCYDENGDRFGFDDRAVHVTLLGESFLDIARAYDVCLQDLWDANPVMDAWDGWWYLLPTVVFIPDTDPCAQQQFTVQSPLTLHGISLLTNTCLNRLTEANPTIETSWSELVPEGMTLTIPQRPHCYDFSSIQGGLRLQPHICYTVPVTAEADFTGHKPAVSASLNTDLPYCYDRVQGMTIFNNNAPYTLYQMRGYESMLVLSQCFDVEPEAFLTLNLYDRFNSAWSVTPASLNMTYQGPLLIPQPHSDCALLTVDDGTHWQRYVEMTYKAGSVQDGVYIVNYGDTLSSIGRKFGYLPQAIADENNLTDPAVIYYLQELKMPSTPSLYTLAPVGAAAGGLVLAGAIFLGLRRWSRGRAKGKKKNS